MTTDAGPAMRRTETIVRIGGTVVCLLLAAVYVRLTVGSFSEGSYVSGVIDAAIVLLALGWAIRFARGAAGGPIVAWLASRKN